MVELVDTGDSKSPAAKRESSSLSVSTTIVGKVIEWLYAGLQIRFMWVRVPSFPPDYAPIV